MKGLNKVRKGIYSLDGFQIYPAEEFGIIVHPFYDLDGRDNYLKNLYNFLNAFEGPVLTLEEYNVMDETIGRYRRNCHASNRFFVKTWDSFPEPKEIGWRTVKNFINEFKPKKIKAAGGYYDYCDEYGHSGCLGDTINILKRDFKDIEAVEGCTFGSLANSNH